MSAVMINHAFGVAADVDQIPFTFLHRRMYVLYRLAPKTDQRHRQAVQMSLLGRSSSLLMSIKNFRLNRILSSHAYEVLDDIFGGKMKDEIEHTFDGVGYQKEVDGTLVLEGKRLVYYVGGNTDSQKTDVSIQLSRIKAANFDDTKLQIVASQKKEIITYEFVFSIQSDAMLAAVKITKLRSKNQIGKATTLPQEPAALIIVDDSEATTKVKQNESGERTSRSNNDLSLIRAISKEMNKDRRAKRKAAPKQSATVAGAEPVNSDRVSQIPPKKGLRGNKAPSAPSTPKQPTKGARAGPVSRSRGSQMPPKKGLRRNNAPSANTSSRRNRPVPPSLTASETDEPALATESPYGDDVQDTGSDDSNSENEIFVDVEVDTNDGGYLVEPDASTTNQEYSQGYLVEATLVPEVEDCLQDEEAKLLVEAHEMDLSDHLQSRKLQFFVVGLACCIVVVTVVVVVVVLTQIVLPSSTSNEPSNENYLPQMG